MEEQSQKKEEEATDAIKKMAEEIGGEKAFPKDYMDLSDETVEGIYAQAYRLYKNGQYKEASQLFRFLIMLNVGEPKYLLGLGACLQMLKEYLKAAEAYALCSAIDPSSPLPYYHASDCYLKMNDKVSAAANLELAAKHAGDRPEYATIKDRCLMGLENIKKELSE